MLPIPNSYILDYYYFISKGPKKKKKQIQRKSHDFKALNTYSISDKLLSN